MRSEVANGHEGQPQFSVYRWRRWQGEQGVGAVSPAPALCVPAGTFLHPHRGAYATCLNWCSAEGAGQPASLQTRTMASLVSK